MAADGLEAEFTPSGHLLGSAFVRLQDGQRSVLFSGDIGRSGLPNVRDPEPPAGSVE